MCVYMCVIIPQLRVIYQCPSLRRVSVAFFIFFSFRNHISLEGNNKNSLRSSGIVESIQNLSSTVYAIANNLVIIESSRRYFFLSFLRYERILISALNWPRRE